MSQTERDRIELSRGRRFVDLLQLCIEAGAADLDEAMGAAQLAFDTEQKEQEQRKRWQANAPMLLALLDDSVRQLAADTRRDLRRLYPESQLSLSDDDDDDWTDEELEDLFG